MRWALAGGPRVVALRAEPIKVETRTATLKAVDDDLARARQIDRETGQPTEKIIAELSWLREECLPTPGLLSAAAHGRPAPPVRQASAPGSMGPPTSGERGMRATGRARRLCRIIDRHGARQGARLPAAYGGPRRPALSLKGRHHFLEDPCAGPVANAAGTWRTADSRPGGGGWCGAAPASAWAAWSSSCS
jgi:hypothetical protein